MVTVKEWTTKVIEGLFTKERIMFQKPFENVILTLSWFQSLILPFVNAKLFQTGVLDRDLPREADFTLCERKALLERDSCVHIVEMHAEAMHAHGSICAVGTTYLAVCRGTAFAMLVNAHSSNHEPNYEADRDPKRFSQHYSLFCEQALSHF